MARANTYQTQNKKSNKGKIGLFSAIGVVLVAGIIVLGLWLGGVFTKEEAHDYFSDIHTMKINFAEINKKLEDKENVFIFVYNNDEFNAKIDDSDDDFDQNDTDIESQVRSLIETCKNKNDLYSEELFFVYLLDTSVEGNDAIINNASYGNPSGAPAILYFYYSEYNQSTPEALEKHFDTGVSTTYTLSSSGSKTALVSCLKDIKQFINNIKY